MESYSKVLVDESNIDFAVNTLLDAKEIGFDTETYGLNWLDRMFCLQLATDDYAFYFNFHDYMDGTTILQIPWVLEKLAPVLNDKLKIWYAHNAKFDMHRLKWEGSEILGIIRDTVVWARLCWNQHFQYTLAKCLDRIGLAKDDAVEKYIAKNKCYTMITIKGKGTRVKIKHYDQVPFNIMFEYGCHDAWAGLQLGKKLHKEVDRLYDHDLIRTEEQLTKDTFDMEHRGAMVDLDNIFKGWDYEESNLEKTEEELSSRAGTPYRSGPKWLETTFDKFGVAYERNEKTGNPIFDKKALAKIDHPIAGLVREYRRAEKYISTYYSGFNYSQGQDNGCIHASIRTGGTDTLRFSYASPNLQNIPKEDSDDYEVYVRGCIKPREGYQLAAIDFRQQEFRLMLDYANEKRLIDAVNGGEDLHQATADLVGCTRKHAKVVNFGLLYGMGVETLAATLGISVREAQDLKFLYFAKLPRVEYFIDNVINTAKRRKYLKTWTGRLLRFPHRDMCYKGPNHLIQGGCADMVRKAIVEAAPLFKERKSGILIQVHDELLFEIHNDEMELIPQARDIMKNIYQPFNGMLMDCSIELSHKSWAYKDMREISA